MYQINENVGSVFKWILKYSVIITSMHMKNMITKLKYNFSAHALADSIFKMSPSTIKYKNISHA